MAAIFFASRSPPQWQMSGWTMSMDRECSTASNSSRSTSLSPVASGTDVFAAIDARPARSAGGSGSSTKSGRPGAIASI
jgi:hypothetical protein